MAFVDIPINQLHYQFRSLTWREELAIADLKLGDEKLTRKHLAAALVTVTTSDGRERALTSPDAERVVAQFPSPILARIWLLYRAGLPRNRYFTTKGLFSAPAPRTFAERIAIEQNERNEHGDVATRQMESKFGGEELREAKEVERKIFEDARKRNVLRPVKEGA